MNLKKWSIDHTKGMLLGILTPLVVLPVVLLIIGWVQNYYFEQLWSQLVVNKPYRIKMITISIIANLGWFYFFLNKERFNFAMGVILGSIIFAPYIIYIKFF
ncbi:MAG: hypothetical protein P8N52_09135 [Crocinitomicaceae bacterium]|nr:hypothetical protein [Crocinitomicaceae bacterium]MDG1777507.1 hypothetical protein [Crocinitomicaceae bacterium]